MGRVRSPHAKGNLVSGEVSMPIPTSEELDSLIDSLRALNASELTPAARNVRHDLVSVRAFLFKVEELFAENGARASREPAMMWFERQQGFVRAIRALDRRAGAPLTVEQRVQMRAARAMDTLRSITLDEYKARRPRFLAARESEEDAIAFVERNNTEHAKRSAFTRYLETCTELPTEVMQGIVLATKNYFYGDRSEFLATHGKQFDGLVAEAEKAIVTLQHLSRYLDLISPGRHNRGVAWYLERLERLIKKSRAFASAELVPIQRDDATVRERAFAHELFLVFWHERRARAVAPIWHLLSMEGVQNQLERRALSRLTRRWQLSVAKLPW